MVYDSSVAERESLALLDGSVLACRGFRGHVEQRCADSRRLLWQLAGCAIGAVKGATHSACMQRVRARLDGFLTASGPLQEELGDLNAAISVALREVMEAQGGLAPCDRTALSDMEAILTLLAALFECFGSAMWCGSHQCAVSDTGPSSAAPPSGAGAASGTVSAELDALLRGCWDSHTADAEVSAALVDPSWKLLGGTSPAVLAGLLADALKLSQPMPWAAGLRHAVTQCLAVSSHWVLCSCLMVR